MRSFRYSNLLIMGVALILSWGVLRPGEVSASPVSKAKIVINIPSRTLWLYSDEKLIKYYPVGVGRPGFPTPLGDFQVTRKIINPGWEHPYKAGGRIRIPPGKGNPLGTRWIGFKPHNGGEYGIHGTDRPSSVGRFSSHGCVRMQVKDAEDLFGRVDVGTPVEVIYEVALIRQRGRDIVAIVYRDTLKKGIPTLAQLKEKILRDYPTAMLDDQRLQQALKTPTERPLLVGSLPQETPPPKPPVTWTQAAPPLHPRPADRPLGTPLSELLKSDDEAGR